MIHKHTSRSGATIGQSPADSSFWRIYEDDRKSKPVCGSANGGMRLPLWYLRKIKGNGFFTFDFPEEV